MAKEIVIDELHVSFFVPRNLSGKRGAAIRRTLLGARFQAVLQRALLDTVEQFPALAGIRFSISR